MTAWWTVLAAVVCAGALACGGGGGEEPDATPDGTADVAPDPGDADAAIEAGAETSPADLPAKDEGTVGPDVPVVAGVDYVILAADGLADAAAMWAGFWDARGHKTQVILASEIVEGEVTAYWLLPRLRKVLSDAKAALPAGTPVYLLLLGDAPGFDEDPTAQVPSVPCANDFTEHAGDCQTDNAFADLDDDGVPDVAVGRVPARTEGEAEAYLDKVKAHEAGHEMGVFNRRVAIYTGQANFDPAIDAMLELAVMEGLKRVSHAFDILGAYDNPNSPYYYQPFDDKVVDLFNDGSLMVVYVGHGLSDWTEGLTTEQVGKIHCTKRLPFAFLFACYAGNYVGPDDSVSEALLFKADGPITVFASTDISHPYGNAVLAYEVQLAVLDARPATIGEAMMAAKRGSIENADEFRTMIDGLAATQPDLGPVEQATIRVQHLDMYNLLGDPALSMAYPAGAATFDSGVPASDPSGTLHVTGTTPGLDSGSALVTLEVERDVILQELATINPDKPDTATVQANWAKASDKVLFSTTATVTGGQFAADVEVPASLPDGPYYLKVYADDGAKDAFGFTMIP